MQGINTLGKRQEIEKWMESKKIDLLCMQETKINCNAMECRNGFTWYFSSGVKDTDRDKATKLRSINKKIPQNLPEKIREHRGVGFVCSNELHEHIEKITAHDSNNIVLQIKGKVDLIFHNTYQPHAGEKNEDKKNKEYKTVHEIKEHMKRQNHCYVPVGDFNARILREEGLNPRNFGRHFLKTKRELNEINQDVLNNRERFIDFVHENDLIVKNTMFNKRMKNRCTYKNKNT